MEPDAHVTAVIDLLLTIGYVDGTFHADEQKFIAGYIDWLVENFASEPGAAESWRSKINQVYAALDAEIAGFVSEVVAQGDDSYMRTRLKVRAVALFRSFAPAEQEGALALLDRMIHADATVTPQEKELHDELVAHFRAVPPRAPMPTADQGMVVEAPAARAATTLAVPILAPLEVRYAPDASALHAQHAHDYDQIFRAIEGWEKQRAHGNGRLLGTSDVRQLPAGVRWLDGRTYVLQPSHPTELVVLGDLHGCYSILKAALAQSQFIERVEAFRRDPAKNPDVKLVLLGDYIDRGRFGFEGVLRAALHLLNTYPDNVILLRGNHEYLVRHGDTVVSAVSPAEAVPALSERASVALLEAYRHLFEHMPTALIFERTLLVHGGIPRDMTVDERWRDLSSFDDAVVRFEMMWGDPVDTDHVPVDLQRQSPRFNFGREQFRAFMQRVGCHTLIRGHEQVDDGFHTNFDVDGLRLHTLFSAGGHDNPDLPTDSRYRNVKPMALSLYAGSGAPRAVPWAVQYQPFTQAPNNGFYR
ncbi:MAG TPA: metallophosphoesterase family protein [Kofleriaceae bacterium]